MAAINYTAKRRLASGHTAGFSYSFDIGLTQQDASDKQIKTTHKAIGGQRETWLQRIDYFLDVATEPLDLADSKIAWMREFIASVADGSAFIIDFDGTVASPVSPISYQLESESHKEKRDGNRYLSFTFKVCEV